MALRKLNFSYIKYIYTKKQEIVNQHKITMSNQETETRQINQVREKTSETWGDKIKQKDNQTFRIYFQNINGIQPHQQERWANIIKTTTSEFQADIVGLCETGLNWKDHYTRQKVQQTLRNNNKQTINIYHSQNTATSFTSFLPGGTLLMTTQSWIGRIVQPLHDPAQMGRWADGQAQNIVYKKIGIYIYCLLTDHVLVQHILYFLNPIPHLHNNFSNFEHKALSIQNQEKNSLLTSYNISMILK